MLSSRKKENVTNELTAAIVKTLRTALECIQKLEYTKPNGATGKSEYDYELTARMMKHQAKLALDMVDNIQND